MFIVGTLLIVSLPELQSDYRDPEIVCQGTNNKLARLGSPDDHYKNMVRMYSNCTVLLENLEITYTKEHHDLSFLSMIQEVGGYVLIALNEVATIPLENLHIIRGHTLYDNKFALTIMSNYETNQTAKTQNITRGVRQLSLRSLTAVRLYNQHCSP
ncbi:hypothetical protein JZ751_010127 [Albula glossodonta]|uniref:Receptor L-domain domain-containing protein n=1 Tax=Albula glossodonta TaxID=121402 RepID=A0A8T2N037_9TELE|nr:hypothetical protein JZ751_010127 [Albula glossodonta]